MVPSTSPQYKQGGAVMQTQSKLSIILGASFFALSVTAAHAANL